MPLFSIILEFLARAVSNDKEIENFQMGKEEVKLSMFRDDMILYVENPKNFTKKILKIPHTKIK